MFANKKSVPDQSYIDSHQFNSISFLEANPGNLNFCESISASNTPKNLPKSGPAKCNLRKFLSIL